MTDQVGSSRPIVVGVDGSDPSKLALRWAASLSQATAAPIYAVAAWHLPLAYGWAPGASAGPPEQAPDAYAARMLDETISEVFPGGRPAGLRTGVHEGNAARVLLEQAADATMLVVGSRGHGGFAGLLLGSVSSHCAEHASCPVLVVHGERPPA